MHIVNNILKGTVPCMDGNRAEFYMYYVVAPSATVVDIFQRAYTRFVNMLAQGAWPKAISMYFNNGQAILLIKEASQEASQEALRTDPTEYDIRQLNLMLLDDASSVSAYWIRSASQSPSCWTHSSWAQVSPAGPKRSCTPTTCYVTPSIARRMLRSTWTCRTPTNAACARPPLIRLSTSYQAWRGSSPLFTRRRAVCITKIMCFR
jgi:hypothetical protein